MNSAQDLAMLSALELASKKKIKRKIGQRGAPDAEAAADAAHFLELTKTAAQTLKSVCTLYEWRDQYVAAAAATYPPKSTRKPDGAPGSDTLLDAVVNGAFVALRRATPLPSVGTVRSAADVAPARALLAGAARLAGVEGAAGVLARGVWTDSVPRSAWVSPPCDWRRRRRRRSRADARGGGGGGGGARRRPPDVRRG